MELVQEKTIYDFIDMQGLRDFLVYHPHLLVIFEFLVLHINDYLKLSNHSKDISKSSHI